jgi:hypothetical protein
LTAIFGKMAIQPTWDSASLGKEKDGGALALSMQSERARPASGHVKHRQVITGSVASVKASRVRSRDIDCEPIF